LVRLLHVRAAKMRFISGSTQEIRTRMREQYLLLLMMLDCCHRVALTQSCTIFLV
jgi:hypothetical protein